MKLAIAALALLLFGSGSVARADGSSGDTFLQYTFSNLTFVGGNNCGGPCVETLNVSFEVEESDFEYSIVPGTESGTSSGPLGPFSCCIDVLAAADYAEMFGTGGVEIDIGAGTISSSPLDLQNPIGLGTYPAYGIMYSCPAGTCANDFFNGVPAVMYNFGDEGNGSGTLTISAMPEPPMLPMMLLGILPLAFVRRR